MGEGDSAEASIAEEDTHALSGAHLAESNLPFTGKGRRDSIQVDDY